MNGAAPALNFTPLTEAEREAAADVQASKAQADDWRPVVPVPADAPKSFPFHPLGKPATCWPYRDAQGRTLFLACRFDRPGQVKQVIPLTYREATDGRRAWRWQALPPPRPLYGLDTLAARSEAPVLVVEGEKAADAAARLFPDHVAITSPGGAEAAGKADWTPLKGRRVTVWPDADKPGREYADDVARLAHAAGAASVAVVPVPEDFPEGWDLADAPPEGWTPERLRSELLEKAAPVEPKPEPEPTPEAPDIEAELARLAPLTPIEYERQREGAAERLGIRRVTVLDAEVKKRRPAEADDGAQGSPLPFEDLEPWPEPVDGAALLDSIADAFSRFIVLPEGGAEALALWTLHAHAHDAAYISPVLALTSPEKRCGKTNCLSVLQALTPRPLSTVNITAASLFRSVEKWAPTVLIDEADTFLRDNDELRGVLNSGHARTGAFVVRTVGDEHEAKAFRTWAPKAVALIGRLPDTLHDRSITVQLARKRRDERVEKLRLDRLGELEPLNRRAARWADDNLDTLRRADPDVPAELHDRAADNWRPLLAIADLAGGKWPVRARVVARRLSADTGDADGAAVQLLADVHAIFENEGMDRIASTALVAALAAMEDRPWPEWRQGKPITPRQVARLLGRFGIVPGTVRMADGSTPKGYVRAFFEDAFARYLPGDPQHRHNPQEPAENPPSRSATKAPDVADEKPPKLAETLACGGVAEQIPRSGGGRGAETSAVELEEGSL